MNKQIVVLCLKCLYNPKSKIVRLKDKYEEEFVIDGRKNYQGGTEITLKLVKQNGKWLIDDSK